MAGLMIHLLIADKVYNRRSLLYYIGSIAPDAVSGWKNKDITHYRTVTDRNAALSNLAVNTSPSDDFTEGMLLHLYTDWRWDELVMCKFIKKEGADWLTKYRHELACSSSYAYYNTPWAKDIWNEMHQCDVSNYGDVPGATKDEVYDLILRNKVWHENNKMEKSLAFPPEFVDNFINTIADEYINWKVQHEITYYNSSPCIFNDFIDMPSLSDGELRLECTAKKAAIPEKKWVPAYVFNICKHDVCIGKLNVRIGYTDSLYYGGQIGYGINTEYRGHHYAEKACRLLIPLLKAHGMKRILITNNYTNIASKRTCERLGAKLIRVAVVPQWHDLYEEGNRLENIFEWTID